MFDRVLIANRGEIACRIIESCRRLGVETVAVYSDADAGARHVRMADCAVHIGGSAPAESYLNIERIVRAAVESGAQAVHPGFGFLSERPAFVQAVEAAGLMFIGPSAATMEKMGAKDAAKALMEAANVPVVPGYHGDNQDEDFLADEAGKIGFPLMIKASAGGGGKGMRIVPSADEFRAALTSARREARSAFGDDKVLLERFVQGPRHIEFQIFGDMHGDVVHLFERECSIQRRYQKIIEETPSPFLDDAMRADMGAAAVAAAKAVDYVNAGTVEFIVGADRSFYFMEMNTRLQVEHPVTEMTTGLDLVEWQLRVACGEPLPLIQDEIEREGHAVEVRLYAEDPRQDFLPSVGRIQAFVTPETDADFRLDTGVESGDEVSIHYDPMIAKLVAWDVDREAAIRHLREVLRQTAVFGVKTNLGLLRRIAADPVFAAGDIDTRYIDTHLEDLNKRAAPGTEILDTAALDFLLDSNDASGFECADGFQLNGLGGRRIVLRDEDGVEHTRFVARAGDDFVLREGDAIRRLQARMTDDYTLVVGDAAGSAQYLVYRVGDTLHVADTRGVWRLTRVHPYAARPESASDEAHPGAPMPGRILAVEVAPGDRVSAGQALLVMEGMKMEYTLKASVAGVVEQVYYAVGDTVEAEVPLVEILPDEAEG